MTCQIHEGQARPCAVCAKLAPRIVAAAHDAFDEHLKRHHTPETRRRMHEAAHSYRVAHHEPVFGAPKLLTNAQIAERVGLTAGWVQTLRAKGFTVRAILDGSYRVGRGKRSKRTPWRNHHAVMPKAVAL
jgi:hypothetical protein